MVKSDTIRGMKQIQRPLSEVFAFVADFRHDHLWRREVHGVKYTTPEPVAAVDSQFVEIAMVLGRKRDSWQEIVRCETDATIVCATFKAGVSYVSERTVKHSGNGTELEIRIHYEIGQGWRHRLLRSIMRGFEQRRLNRALLNLKKLLEECKIVHADGRRL